VIRASSTCRPAGRHHGDHARSRTASCRCPTQPVRWLAVHACFFSLGSHCFDERLIFSGRRRRQGQLRSTCATHYVAVRHEQLARARTDPLRQLVPALRPAPELRAKARSSSLAPFAQPERQHRDAKRPWLWPLVWSGYRPRTALTSRFPALRCDCGAGTSPWGRYTGESVVAAVDGAGRHLVLLCHRAGSTLRWTSAGRNSTRVARSCKPHELRLQGGVRQSSDPRQERTSGATSATHDAPVACRRSG
jgi:hypothetical protein